jgi:hypothetical protein
VGNDEDALSTVGSANIGRSVSSPFTRPPDFGKVSEDIGKAQSEVAADVLQDRVSGSYCANGVKDVWPEVSDIILSLSITCMTKWLAGIPARDYVNRLNLRPVNLCDVPKVGNVGVMVCEDLAGCWFDLCIPRKVTTNCDVKTSIASE